MTLTTIRGLTLSEKAQGKPIIDITDQLPKHPVRRWGPRKESDITRIVVHHMASEAPLVNQAKYHISHHDWPGIAYHLCIVKGQIYQTNDLLSLTSHALGANPSGVGIAVLGDLSKRNMTDEERNALYGAIITVHDMFPNAKIQGHNEASWETAKHATSCPCTDMNRIRDDVTQIELKWKQEQSPAAQDETAYRIANEIMWVYNLSRGKGPNGEAATDENIAWAKRRLLQLEPEMRKLGFLK